MPSIVTLADLKAVRRLAFCHACGGAFSARSDRSKDHVPPKAIFDVVDRSASPLLLPAHHACNAGRSHRDERAAKFARILRHGAQAPTGLQLRHETTASRTGEIPHLGVRDVPLEKIVWGWVRAFHAALYGEYLRADIPGWIETPFPESIDHGRFIEPRTPHVSTAVTLLEVRRHARMGLVDRIQAWNGKLRYSCVWVQFNHGAPACFFEVDLYGWGRLGDPRLPHLPGCAGWYGHPRPTRATAGTRLSLPTDSS